MPPALYTQTVIAMVWDFDRTLIPRHMQEPIFRHYQVEARQFWSEVDGLVAHYARRGLRVARDTAYLGHFLSYIRAGAFRGLTNKRLREFGAELEFAPGMPDFMARAKAEISANSRFREHGITVEHYIVSTGFRQMIEGSAVREYVDDIWACEMLADPPGPGYLDQLELEGEDGELAQVGYALDNTAKTRAIFEINKGVNKNPSLDVNARMSEDQRRVPIRNMIYIADGPSDVPVFSVVFAGGGKNLGVYSLAEPSNYEQVKDLEEQSRVHHIAKADYTPGSEADLWLLSSLRRIATEIADRREAVLAMVPGAPKHVG